MNNIQLMGRVTKDLELKSTTSGKSVCSFDIAVNRKFNKDITDFIPCTAWDKTAETMCNYVKKGQLIALDGSLYTRKYTDNNGNNRTAYEVNVNNFYFAESKKSSGADSAYDPLVDFAKKIDEVNIQNQNQSNEDIFSGEDDLPF
jgi:single-strand DNA-binding protein